MATVIPSFLLPRGPAIRGHRTQVLRQVPLVRHSPSCHYASASPSKPRNLEKPTKFRPPSHGQRLKEHVPRQYGPELTKEQKTEQKTKQYPRMMPPEGSFMFWFLTNQTIHLVITLGTLTLLASFAALENWKRDSNFKSRLPEKADILRHPIQSFTQFIFAWRMSLQESSHEASIKRRRGVEDAQKQALYRKAHGYEDEEGIEPWAGTGFVNGDVAVGANAMAGNPERADNAGKTGDVPIRERRQVKKWLGIW